MSKFKEQNESNAPMASTPKGSLRRRLTLYSGLNGKQIDSSSSKSEDEVIQELYKTMFLKPYEDGAERVRKFDFEFSKVIEFFKKTVKQVVDEVTDLIHHTHEIMNDIQEVEMSTNEIHFNEDYGNYDVAQTNSIEHVKINVTTPEIPLVSTTSKSDQTFNKKFYHKLQLLKRYSFLNLLAFSKIKKKYDKFSSKSKMLHAYSIMYCKREGTNTLQPTAKRKRHRITFLLGLFTGCLIALIVAIITHIHARDIMYSEGRTAYMENIFPLYSLFGYIVLHMILYSGNVYFWRHFKINYSFIFGFKEGTELGYREVFLLSSGLAVVSLAAVLSSLDMEMDQGKKSFSTFIELIPAGLVIVVLVIIFCPFNIIYKSSRFFLIKCAFHCICAPLFKVNFPDNFLADQLSSQMEANRSLEFYVCYYFWGNFKTRSNKCIDSDIYKTFYLIATFFPFWTRFLQCLRRLLVEERKILHGLNGLKYLSTIVAVALRTVSDEFYKGNMVWKILFISSSSIATIANTYWDIAIDWGLLRRNSRNPWLRDKLIVPYKSVYFVAIVLNVILRLAWMQSVFGIKEAPFLHKTALTAVAACLEILRRGIWNFFRLENEHLNNVGKYREFKTVPLAVNYQDDDEESTKREEKAHGEALEAVVKQIVLETGTEKCEEYLQCYMSEKDAEISALHEKLAQASADLDKANANFARVLDMSTDAIAESFNNALDQVGLICEMEMPREKFNNEFVVKDVNLVHVSEAYSIGK
ncbi:EXS (ERD1/XPR1/SYG1) family protein [Trifolium repens]|nr:EXS (ERD1/XPR1/SYG1) family protein [Trifolium repens]